MQFKFYLLKLKSNLHTQSRKTKKNQFQPYYSYYLVLSTLKNLMSSEQGILTK